MHLLEREKVEIRTLPEEPSGLSGMIYFLLPWVILIAVYWLVWRRMWQSMGGAMGRRGVEGFLAGSAGKESRKGSRVTFADVARQENAKREVAELVDFLPESQIGRASGTRRCGRTCQAAAACQRG